MHDLLGDYPAFFRTLMQHLDGAGIDVTGCPVSHLAYRVADMREYVEVREQIREYGGTEVENVWNGRTIGKLLLPESLVLAPGFETALIELIPPPHRGDYPMGLEHAGFVLGFAYDTFAERHQSVLTGQQDQGQYCRPWYITFADRLTAKFYRYSLKDVVELEGRRFVAPPQVTAENAVA